VFHVRLERTEAIPASKECCNTWWTVSLFAGGGEEGDPASGDWSRVLYLLVHKLFCVAPARPPHAEKVTLPLFHPPPHFSDTSGEEGQTRCGRSGNF
jgi:hypothetical protein